ncbi:MAG: phosphatase PAP2 family protein, partial [Halocynthiibacter sp.]
LPYIVPFYADPFFAELDRVMMGGTDPWELVYAFAEYLPMQVILPVYLKGWALPAIFLPVFLAALDGDRARVNRFLILYVVAWVVLGNILALVGMSAGPVYYDRLIEGAQFGELTAALQQSGVKSAQLGQIQENLWTIYAEQGQAIGSGISAFPSVHVAIATVFGLYLAERARLLAPLGLLFVVIILFLSVYTGYHYAIDGYASIAVIVGLWWLLRRRAVRA